MAEKTIAFIQIIIIQYYLLLSIMPLMLIFNRMKKLTILLILLFNTSGSSTYSQSPIIGLKSVDIIRGWRQSNDVHIAAINISMEKGWKTYWRVPGVGGIPPLFDWNKSKNIKSISKIWPTPNIYNEYGLRTIGYKEEFILPIKIKPIDQKKPIYLEATIDFGICADVCIPIQTTVEAELPVRTSIGKNRILEVLDRAIISGSESPIKVITCDIIPLKDGFEVKATLENIASFNENTFGVIEYPEKPNSWISQKTSLVSGNQLEVIATLYLDGTYFVDRSNLNLTVFSSNKAFEFDGCLS